MDARRFLGKTVVITAAAHGIGAATARRFLAEGAQVAAIDREADGFADFRRRPRRALARGRRRLHRRRRARRLPRPRARGLRPDRRALQQCRPERPGAARPSSMHSSEEVWRFVLEVSLFDRHADGASRRARPCASAVTAGSSTCRATRLSSATRASPITPRRRWASSASPARSRASSRRSASPSTLSRRARSAPARMTGSRQRSSIGSRRARRPASSPSRRMSRAASPFSRSDDARYVTGQTLLIDGGRWMV